jgi:molybdopterin synthase sulfur carrier subunit
MKAVYFAWVRERIGVAEEEIAPPESVETVGQLIDWLAARGEGYAVAFANRKSVRAALDKTHVTAQTPIAAAREIAFFPPMTGG